MSKALGFRLFKGASIIIALTILTTPLGYFIRVFYAQTMSVEMYGLFYSALAMFGILTTYNDLGFGYSVAYLVPKFIKQKEFAKAWNVYKYDQIIEISTSVIISIILFLLADFLAVNYFKVPIAKNLIYVLTIYFVSNSFLEALTKMFTGLQKEHFYSSIQPVRLFFTLFISIIFAFYGAGDILNYAWAWALGYILTSVIFQAIFYTSYHNIINKLIWDKSLFKSMASYALPTLVTTSIYTFINSTDIFYLTLFKGVKDVGIYNVALPIASISNIFISPINNLILPMVSETADKENHKTIYLLNIILKIIPFVSVYFALFIIMFPEQTVSILFGSKWVSLVALPLMIMAGSLIFSTIAGFLTSFVSGLGKVKARFYATILIALINLTFSGLMIYQYGVVGAVMSNLFLYFISAVIYGLIIHRQVKFSLPVYFYLRLISSAILLFLLVKFLNINPRNLTEYILTGTAYSLIMFLISIFLKLIDKDSYKLFLNLIKLKNAKW